MKIAWENQNVRNFLKYLKLWKCLPFGLSVYLCISIICKTCTEIWVLFINIIGVIFSCFHIFFELLENSRLFWNSIRSSLSIIFLQLHICDIVSFSPQKHLDSFPKFVKIWNILFWKIWNFQIYNGPEQGVPLNTFFAKNCITPFIIKIKKWKINIFTRQKIVLLAISVWGAPSIWSFQN